MLDAVIFFVRPAYKCFFWIKSSFTFFHFFHTSSFSFLSGIATLAQNRLTRVQSLLSRKPAPHSSPQPKERDIKKRENRERERRERTERTERNLFPCFSFVLLFLASPFPFFLLFFPFLRLNICYCNQDLHRKMLQISSCSKNFGRKDRNKWYFREKLPCDPLHAKQATSCFFFPKEKKKKEYIKNIFMHLFPFCFCSFFVL